MVIPDLFRNEIVTVYKPLQPSVLEVAPKSTVMLRSSGPFDEMNDSMCDTGPEP
jgi:hypothetical protein